MLGNLSLRDWFFFSYEDCEVMNFKMIHFYALLVLRKQTWYFVAWSMLLRSNVGNDGALILHCTISTVSFSIFKTRPWRLSISKLHLLWWYQKMFRHVSPFFIMNTKTSLLSKFGVSSDIYDLSMHKYSTIAIQTPTRDRWTSKETYLYVCV